MTNVSVTPGSDEVFGITGSFFGFSTFSELSGSSRQSPDPDDNGNP
jgi:hypothetical protein